MSEPADPVAEALRKAHPGFTICCDKCGSKLVKIENSLGYSAMSGGWGSIDLECLACKNTVAIFENM